MEKMYLDRNERAVLSFIERRFPKDSNWTSGNCYWFAKILADRFMVGDGNIFYDFMEGHFVTLIEGSLYDYNGKWDGSYEDVICLSQIEIEDPSWYSRLVRDCIM